jgi:hypothetical protein
MFQRFQNLPFPKRFVIILVLVICSLWAVGEIRYQLQVQAMTNELKRIEQVAIKPLGGVANAFNGPQFESKCPYYFDALMAIDTGPCPIVMGGWYVPVSPNNEDSKTLMKTILQKAGYIYNADDTNHSGGSKDNFGVSLYIENRDDPRLPPAGAGKSWIGLGININDGKTISISTPY